jgi:hypothetical protein
MSNTGLGTEEQLQLVRAEVKTFFPCESAMWASFSGGATATNAETEEPLQPAAAGRGVVILVLGPLAPRTGWIKSDSTGCVISASARIKPNLPVLTFIACDFGGVVTGDDEHPSMLFLSDLARAEYDKDNLVVIGGNLSGDVAKPPIESSYRTTKQIYNWIQTSGVNITVVCDSSVPQENGGSFSEDFLVCQKKKAMSIVGVEILSRLLNGENCEVSPCLVKLNISGWPKKSFAVQLKVKSFHKAETPTGEDKTNKCSKKTDLSSRDSAQTSRQTLNTALIGWQKHLQDFSHNLQGILHTNIDQAVQCNCLRQLLTDILNRVHADPARIDTPGFACTLYVARLSSLVSLPEVEFLANASVIEQIMTSWTAAVSRSITSAELRPKQA